MKNMISWIRVKIHLTVKYCLKLVYLCIMLRIKGIYEWNPAHCYLYAKPFIFNGLGSENGSVSVIGTTNQSWNRPCICMVYVVA